MKSNVCKIDNGTKDLEAILKESERVASYNGFDQKQTLQLRLLCEEMDSMLPNIIDDFDGDFWIEYEDGVCKVNAAITFAEFSVDKKKELINVASDKKNAAAKGLVGKIRCAIEEMFLPKGGPQYCDIATLFNAAMDSSVGVTSAYMWSLQQYRGSIEKASQAEEWDELEKSIFASIADDVIVGVKGRKATITIVKKFA